MSPTHIQAAYLDNGREVPPTVRFITCQPRRWLVPLVTAFALAGVLISGALGTRQRTASARRLTPNHPTGRTWRRLESLPLGLQGVVSRTLGENDRAYSVSRGAGGLVTRNASQRFSARFSSSGVVVTTGSGTLRLALRAVGHGNRLVSLRKVTPRSAANQVRFRRQGLTEWYANGPVGLEQGFTIARRPTGAAGPLTLALSLGGSLHAQLTRDWQTLVLTARGGAAVLRYAGLRATDSTGRVLGARLELAGTSLLLRVDDAHARYPLTIDPYIQQGSKLTASDESGEGDFGYSVALSSDGNTALIGGRYDDSAVGAAWVFTRSGSTWSQQGSKLTASDETGAAGYFGYSVALSGDGNTALIGGANDDSGVGAAWVFTRSGSTWSQQGSKLTASDETGDASFGASVALSSDGNTALIAGSGDDGDMGAAWVFTRSGSTWSQQGSKLTASVETVYFGYSVALSSDGNTALIGDIGDDSGVGAAWVFTRSGSTWSEQGSKLTASDEIPAAYFGYSVALSSDGNTALIGGWADNSDAGAAWVFTRSGSTWTQQGSKLTASDETGAASLGASVALSGDGNTALIGGANDDDAGAAWVFTRSGSTWTQQGSKLTACDSTGYAAFGDSVALSSDGSTALIGGPDDNGDIGAAWPFTPSGTGCSVIGPPPPPFTFSATFGTPFNGIVAGLHPPGGPGNLSQETATIAWGDGSITQASLAMSPTDSTELDVSGTHTYWIAGQASVVITLTNTQTGTSQTFNGSVLVSSRYAALGDSYAAGEGSGWPPGQTHPNLAGCDFQPSTGGLYEGGTDHIDGASVGLISPFYGSGCITADAPHPLTGDICHRSITAYGHVVDRLLALNGMTMTLVACSGGVVNNAYVDADSVFNDKEHQTGTPEKSEPPQVEALGRHVSLITLTMGGNNAGFAGMAKNCVTAATLSATSAACVSQDDTLLSRLGYNTTPRSAQDGQFTFTQAPITPGTRTLTQLLTYSDTLDHQGCARNTCFGTDLHDALVLLYRELRNAAPGARILVVGYPHFFPTGGTGGDCEHFTQFDQTWINNRIQIIDQIIADAASESGVAQYVDAYNAFNGHAECAPSAAFSVDPTTHAVAPCTGAWINGIDIAAALLGTPEVLHPNPCGQQQLGALAANAYSAGQSPTDQFNLAAGATHATTIGVPAGTGPDRRLTVTLESGSDGLSATLTDPSGKSYAPVQSAPAGPAPLVTVWTIWQPPAGTWTLETTNVTTTDLGTSPAQVLVGFGSPAPLPPAGVAQVVSQSCIHHILFTDCTATLGASVANALKSEVAGFTWFDAGGGTQLGQGNTVKVSGAVPFSVILKTNGTASVGGQYRLTTCTVTGRGPAC